MSEEEMRNLIERINFFHTDNIYIGLMKKILPQFERAVIDLEEARKILISITKELMAFSENTIRGGTRHE